MVMSPSWKYTNCLCVLVPCSLVPAGYNRAQCSQRKTITVCLHWIRIVTVHSDCAYAHHCTHTRICHGSTRTLVSNTEPLWSRSIFFSLKKLVVLAFAQCATKYIYILLHSLPSLGVWEKVQQTKTRFLFGGGHHSCPSQQSPHRFKI